MGARAKIQQQQSIGNVTVIILVTVPAPPPEPEVEPGEGEYEKRGGRRRDEQNRHEGKRTSESASPEAEDKDCGERNFRETNTQIWPESSASRITGRRLRCKLQEKTSDRRMRMAQREGSAARPYLGTVQSSSASCRDFTAANRGRASALTNRVHSLFAAVRALIVRWLAAMFPLGFAAVQQTRKVGPGRKYMYECFPPSLRSQNIETHSVLQDPDKQLRPPSHSKLHHIRLAIC